MSVVLVYDSNNSGGSWWLNDDAWLALEREGWTVHWDDRTCIYGDDPEKLLVKQELDESRWLGAMATSCAKRVESPQEGIAEWERITGENAADQGCNCCGPPHSFCWFDEDGERHYVGLDFPTSGTLVF